MASFHFNATVVNFANVSSHKKCLLLDEMFQWRREYLTYEVFSSSVMTAIAALLLFPSITFANVLVFYIFLKTSSKSVTNMLLCSMSITDFIIGAVVLPLVVATRISEITGNENLVCYGRHGYKIVAVLCVGASTGHLTFISIERVIAFKFPVKKGSILNRRRTLAGILFVWLYSAGASVAVSSVVRPIPRREMASRSCYLAICTVLVVCCYSWILSKLKRDVKSIKDKEVIEKVLKEAKLAKTMACTCLAFLAFYLPEAISNAIVACPEHDRVNMVHIVLNWTQILAYSNSLFNPVWYSFSIPFVRREINRCLRALSKRPSRRIDVIN